MAKGPVPGAGLCPSVAGMTYTIPLNEFGTDETGDEIHGLWAVIRRGYSATVPVRVWLYPSEEAALRAAADMVITGGGARDREDEASELRDRGAFQEVVELYNTIHQGEGAFVVVDQAIAVEEAFASQFRAR